MAFIEYLQSANGYDVLMAIADMQPCTVLDISQDLEIETSSIYKRFILLERMGIAYRHGNGPAMTLALTVLGEAVAGQIRKIIRSDTDGSDCSEILRKGKMARLLVIMAAYTPCRMTTLVRIAGGCGANQYECINRMEELGVVTVTPGVANSKIVTLTSRGCEVWSHLREILATIDPDEYESYIDSLAPIGRSYGDLIIPDIPDYCRCAYASATVLDDPLVCVSVRLDDPDGSGLRPVYEAAFLESNGLFCICHDYNPNTGLWTSCDQDVTAETVRNHMEREGTRPMKGFEFREAE